MLLSDFDKSKYFKAEDVDEDEPLTLRIKSVSAEKVGQGANIEIKPVLSFHGEEKLLILNKVNNRVLRGAFGDDSNNMLGKSIVLFRTYAEMSGKQVPALRIRIPTPKKPAKPVPPPLPDDGADDLYRGEDNPIA